jgi:hypothetical protein
VVRGGGPADSRRMRQYTPINGNERHIRREVAEAHGITPGQAVEGAALLQLVRESIDLERRDRDRA